MLLVVDLTTLGVFLLSLSISINEINEPLYAPPRTKLGLTDKNVLIDFVT